VRYFLSGQAPPVTRILLIESGSRELGEQAIACLRKAFGAGIPIDALGCRRTPLLGVESYADVSEARTLSARLALLRRIRRGGYSVAGVLSSGDSTMALWKWAAIGVVPAKFLVLNENVDFFWIDRAHWTNAVALLQQRSGLGGESTVRAMAWFAALPFAALFLLSYATWVHVTRIFRLLLGIRTTVRSNSF
jgi:hypothetical protein